MRILSVGNLSGLSNTCLHRNWALHRLADQVDEVNTLMHSWSLLCRFCFFLFRKGFPVPIVENDGENQKIIDHVSRYHYDIIWIDKGLTIHPDTLRKVKRISPQTIIISYSPDNMAKRHNQSQQYLRCLPLYDCIVTNKSHIVDDLLSMGAQKVIAVNNSYEPTFHHPYTLTVNDVERFGCDVGFVGAWEQDRCRSICYLVDNGIKVCVIGDGRWRNYIGYSSNLCVKPCILQGEDYCKALQSSKISLCFLRKINDDVQTTRTIEIPACGGFMLAERTAEHQSLFVDGIEAVFFSSDEELLAKCRYYLAHDDERNDIAARGNQRCITSGYSHDAMIQQVLDIIKKKV